MKKMLLGLVTCVTLLSIPASNFAQAPTLGTAANFVLFTTTGAVGNTGISRLTGNVGSNTGSSTGFGNVNGTMHNNNGATDQARLDLTSAYNQIQATPNTLTHAPLIGNGETLFAGVYAMSGLSTLSGALTLDAQGNANAVFIFKIDAAFSTTAESKIMLINGAQACNVFWKIEGV
ncbi:MAG TPA: ice-binding family protein, partial [Segetibacter sp.]